MTEPIHILSLGAGVQSSTMALMAALGEITPMPVAAIFADTGDEPQAVMDWLDTLERLLPFPVRRLQRGVLSRDFLAALRGESNRCGQPPFFVRKPDSDGTATADSGGMLWRQCTAEYKLQPIRKETARLRKVHGAKRVVQWIGISLDEAHRMKDSRVGYIENRYPLVDLRMTRGDCLLWMQRNGFPQPPKSACVFCPYISNARWAKLKHQNGEAWRRAVAFDRAIRQRRAVKVAAGIKGEIFVHRSMKPLDQVHFGSDEETGQQSLFGNECEGMCGV